MERTEPRRALLGGVVLASIAGLILAAGFIAQPDDRAEAEYDILFDRSVSGLAQGSAVGFRGVPVGRVTLIEIWKRDQALVRVRIAVERDTPVLRGTTASIDGVGVTGTSRVALTGTVKGAPPLGCAADVERNCPDGVPVIPARAAGVGAVLDAAPNLLNQVSALTDKLAQVTSTRNARMVAGISSNARRLGRAVANNGPQLQDIRSESRATFAKIERAAATIRTLVKTAKATLEAGEPVVGDFRRAAETATRTRASLNAAVADIRPATVAISQELIPEAQALGTDLSATAGSVNSIRARAREEGLPAIIGPRRLPDHTAKQPR